MVEIKLSIANDDVDAVDAFLKAQIEELADRAIAPVPTTKTNMATTMMVLWGFARKQIKDHRALVAQKEAAAKAARRRK